MDDILSGRRVLVVEDEMMVLMNIEYALADLGCTSVTAAATVTQALALISANRYDLAMLDLNLGGTRSYPVAAALAAQGVPFLFSTGYGDHGIEGYGRTPVLQKPYKDAELARMLTRILAGPAVSPEPLPLAS